MGVHNQLAPFNSAIPDDAGNGNADLCDVSGLTPQNTAKAARTINRVTELQCSKFPAVQGLDIRYHLRGRTCAPVLGVRPVSSSLKRLRYAERVVHAMAAACAQATGTCAQTRSHQLVQNIYTTDTDTRYACYGTSNNDDGLMKKGMHRVLLVSPSPSITAVVAVRGRYECLGHSSRARVPPGWQEGQAPQGQLGLSHFHP